MPFKSFSIVLIPCGSFTGPWVRFVRIFCKNSTYRETVEKKNKKNYIT